MLIREQRQDGARGRFAFCSTATALIARFIIFAVMGVFAFAAHAYDPPIGIPNPSWGSIHPIDTTAPPWPAAWPNAQAAGYYYVDNSSANATDTNNPYGYPAKPRLTIPTATYGAGSYVEIHGGTYSGNLTLEFNCTVSAPCWFRGADSQNMPKFNGSMNVTRNSAYMVLEYLNFDGGTGGAILISGNSHHISLRRSAVQNRADNGSTGGITLYPTLGQSVHDVVLYGNTLRELGDWQNTTVDIDFLGINLTMWNRDSTTEMYNIWALENSCYHVSSNCFQANAGIWPDSGKYLHHVYVGRNVSHENRQGGFWAKQSTHVIISQNEAYDNRKYGDQPGQGIGYQYGPDNLWIIFNKIYSSNYGIRQSDTGTEAIGRTAYILGNVIYDIHPQVGLSYSPTNDWRPGMAIALWEGNMNRYVIDNTIYDVSGGISDIQSGPLYVSGNIIANISPDDFHLSTLNGAGDISVSNALFYLPGGSARFSWKGTTYNSLSAFQGATGNCGNCFEGNPAFVDPSGNDFQIRSESAARDRNIRADVYARFQTLYGIDIAKDYTGKPRPAGNTSWDIGAYQYTSGGDTLAPAAPTNLTVQ